MYVLFVLFLLSSSVSVEQLKHVAIAVADEEDLVDPDYKESNPQFASYYKSYKDSCRAADPSDDEYDDLDGFRF